MDILYILIDLWRTRNLQQWVNNRFNDPSKVVLDINQIEKVITCDGLTYMVTEDLKYMQMVKDDYSFNDIHKDDIVIDIGANIGGFCLPASRLSDNVYAVEPITTQELRKNISLNNANITVIESALGDGSEMSVE